jgi:hypothetical protein
MFRVCLIFFSVIGIQGIAAPQEWSGIYPSLAYFNNEGECGTGAVVPWADRLWVITYGPHCPYGSSDKLYEITPSLEIITRPESVGGTPANRMIHEESKQLIIGPYFIDAKRNVRAISPKLMPGRLTGNARHLTEPGHKIYFATMEDGLFEVDVHTLAVKGLIKEIKNHPKAGQTVEINPATLQSTLPGYHAKGLYSGQGVVVIANNGEDTPAALKNPNIDSGAIGEWNGSGNWQLVRRNQFTEVTGPGGIKGNANPATDPIWTIGWDYRSVILMVKENGEWNSYRLPKASHTYDGAHGWNTEWPRIRDIGEAGSRLMTMHGMFWNFPETFSVKNSAGIYPRSTYLKVIGDFTRWNDRLVFGCDDTAKSEFLNKREAKGKLAGPRQSQSNLWFTSLDKPDHLGPVLGHGSVWLNESVKAQVFSDPFLLSGFTKRALHLEHDGIAPTVFTLEIDSKGNNQWSTWRQITVPAETKSVWLNIPQTEQAVWVRIKTQRDVATLSATFQYAGQDNRTTDTDPIFAGLSQAKNETSKGAFLLTTGNNKRTLAVLNAEIKNGQTLVRSLYELNADMQLVHADPSTLEKIKQVTEIPKGIITVDEASVIFIENGQRWRLPHSFEKNQDSLLESSSLRKAREVCTERDLLQAHGTFYELPALNAMGAMRMRPIATSDLAIHDFCSYRGLLVLSGINPSAKNINSHIISSKDGEAAVWVGTADDLWKLGKPRGHGGPWKNSSVKANEPSDPYLMTGYDKKKITLENHHNTPNTIIMECDVAGDGRFSFYETVSLAAHQRFELPLPEWLNAYWVRFTPIADGKMTVQLTYE